METNAGYEEIIKSCESKMASIYNSYLNDITPFIILLETIDSEYPAEIMNEIRAIFTHFARYYECMQTTGTINEVVVKKLESQIELAEGHLKRCKLDCYKYACLSYSDMLLTFDSYYKAIDLTYVERGEFIRDFNDLRSEAYEKFIYAKKIDTTGYKIVPNIDDSDLIIGTEEYKTYLKFVCDDELYEAYEEAYIKYHKCIQLIKKHRKDFDFLQKKATKKDIAAVAGIVIGIVGIATSIVMGIISAI